MFIHSFIRVITDISVVTWLYSFIHPFIRVIADIRVVDSFITFTRLLFYYLFVCFFLFVTTGRQTETSFDICGVRTVDHSYHSTTTNHLTDGGSR